MRPSHRPQRPADDPGGNPRRSRVQDANAGDSAAHRSAAGTRRRPRGRARMRLSKMMGFRRPSNADRADCPRSASAAPVRPRRRRRLQRVAGRLAVPTSPAAGVPRVDESRDLAGSSSGHRGGRQLEHRQRRVGSRQREGCGIPCAHKRFHSASSLAAESVPRAIPSTQSCELQDIVSTPNRIRTGDLLRERQAS